MSPEIYVALLSFAFHFVWEMLQVPGFTGMAELPHWDGILICTQATIGDVGIALTAYWVTSLFARSRRWIVAPGAADFSVFLGVGIIMTVVFEIYATQIAYRWTYSSAMPVLPLVGIGLAPLLQWLVLPSVVVFLSRRLLTATSVDHR